MSDADLDLSAFCEFEEPVPKRERKPFEEYGGKSAQIWVIPVVRKNRQDDPNGIFINCTSSGDGVDRQTFSPFYLGPCRLYGDYTARRMENGWQFSKVYPEHLGGDGTPTAEYFKWAECGWTSTRAYRYPMGKKRNGEAVFHWWDGQALSKVEARKRIYVPLYAEQVISKVYFKALKKVWDKNQGDQEFTLYLMDFDAYPYGTMTFSEILNNPKKSMGHGFVLAMLLTDDPALKECQIR